MDVGTFKKLFVKQMIQVSVIIVFLFVFTALLAHLKLQIVSIVLHKKPFDNSSIATKIISRSEKNYAK